jgi:adenylate cyclase
MTPCDTSEVARWLMGGARPAHLAEELLEQLCERMIAAGVPLASGGFFVRTLYPGLYGRSFIWHRGSRAITLEFPYDSAESRDLQQSAAACIRGSSVAFDPSQEDSCMSLPLFKKLHNDGVTALLATPIVFADDGVHLAVWTTRQVGGFTAEQTRNIEALIPPFTRVVEIFALRRRATVLLDTYVGHATGERILAGGIHRGHTEELHAAIWLSDMRGFTELADRLPPRVLIDLLNRYFDCQIPAIVRRGGEVLKFIGDGLLTIFPIEADDSDAARVCSEALAAAYEARARIASMEQSELGAGHAPVRFGVALHVGTVMYGNVGGENRLDFTCIGPAVNLAARMEKLTGGLGRTILASEDFARVCGGPMSAVGDFVLAGFAQPQKVFGLPEEAG